MYKLEFNSYGLNFGENLIYLDTYIKGKVKNPTVEDYRILFRGENTNKEYLYIHKMENFFKRPFIYRIEYIDSHKTVSSTHIKSKNYNYYKYRNNVQDVIEMLDAWKKTDPLVSNGVYLHSFISKIPNYTWSYKIDNKTF